MRTPEQFPKPTEPPQVRQFLSNSTKFTLCVYWQKKPNGQYYSVPEINAKQHRKYIDSYDYHIGEQYRSITRHDEAFYKMLVWIQKRIANASKAVIYMNDHGNEKQYCIAKLCADEDQCKIVYPTFSDPSDNPLGHVYVTGLNGPPLDTFDLVQRVLTKKTPSINQLNKAA